MRQSLIVSLVLLLLAPNSAICDDSEGDYSRWKQRKEKFLQGWTFTDRIEDLIQWFEALRKPSWTGEISEGRKKESLYYYNYVRELLKQPPVSDLSQIDAAWIGEVKTVNLLFKPLAIKGPTEKEQLATPAQEKLIKVAMARVNLDSSKFKLWGGDSASQRDQLTLCVSNDLDIRLGALYHELGHIKHNDLDINEHHKRLKDPNRYLESPAIDSDTKRIQRYSMLASQVIDKSTTLGTLFNSILLAHPWVSGRHSYWIIPENSADYLKFSVARNEEERADLFMLDELFKQGNTDSILKYIESWAGSGYFVVDGTKDKHPSDFERALYMAGFLIDHNQDINQLFQTWETKGKCIDAEDSYELWEESGQIATYFSEKVGGTSHSNPLKAYGDFLAAYREWERESENQGYESWKKLQKDRWENKDLNSSKYELLSNAFDFFSKSMDEPLRKWHQQNALRNYNFARELYNLPKVSELSQIDRKWLDSERYNTWKEQRETLLKGNVLEFRILFELNRIRDNWKEAKIAPQSHFPKEELLYNYNYLRELLGQSTVKNISQIDALWLVKTRSTYENKQRGP